jgi:preprotein translocase subunit SecF
MRRFNIDFVKKFPVAVIVSSVLILGSLGILVSKGLNYGVDFRGGAEIQVRFADGIDLAKLRKTLKDDGFSASSVQRIGEEANNEIVIKVQASEENINEVTDKITSTLNSNYKQVEIRKTDIVGPKAGEQLRISGFQAMLYALIGIMIYIGLRFDFKYSPGAIMALFHDVVIILGIFALTNSEFSLQIVGALLAVIGYSVNDTVVVYDRVREHEENGTASDLKGNINIAINQTLSRTFLTSITTLCVSLAMLFWGGGIIRDFFFAISLGVIIGTYSSIFVAAPVTILFDRMKTKAA